MGVLIPMNIKEKKRKVCVMGILGAVLFMAGCGPAKTEEPFQRLTLETNLGSTIGSLVEVFASDIIIAEGYALVGGLRGTGSTQCDPAIGEYLKKYILKQLPGQQGVKEFINRPSAAEYLGISVRTLDRMLRERQIPFYRLRGRVYFLKKRLNEWLTSLEHNPMNRKDNSTVQAGKRERKKSTKNGYKL